MKPGPGLLLASLLSGGASGSEYACKETAWELSATAGLLVALPLLLYLLTAALLIWLALRLAALRLLNDEVFQAAMLILRGAIGLRVPARVAAKLRTLLGPQEPKALSSSHALMLLNAYSTTGLQALIKQHLVGGTPEPGPQPTDTSKEEALREMSS